MTVTLLQAGIAHHRTGRLAEAEAAYRAALASGRLGPLEQAQARCLAGVIAVALGRSADGIALIRQAIADEPRVPDFQANLGAALLQSGDAAGAVEACRRALRMRSGLPQAQLSLGLALRQLGRTAEAVAVLSQAAASLANDPSCHRHLGLALRDLGRAGEAEAALRRALALDPAGLDHLLPLAGLLVAAGRAAEARTLLAARGAAGPVAPAQVPALAEAFAAAGDPATAETLFRQGVQAAGGGPGPAMLGLGLVLHRLGRPAEAAPLLETCASAMPDTAMAQAGLANLRLDAGRPADAATLLRTARRLEPDNPRILHALGNALRDSGEIDAAIAMLEAAVAADPADADAHSNLLYSRLFHPATTLADIRRDHVAWAARHAAPVVPAPPAHRRDLGVDPLRIGLVSADFRRHPVGYFIVRALEALAAHGRLRLFAYANQRVRDDITDRIAAACTGWRDIRDADDATAAAMVRADGIDILIDLSGHIAGNRLRLFAQRPAPLQAAWAGYMATTGLAQMDVIIADPHHIPPGSEGAYVERVLRLPHSFLCFEPPADSGPVTPLPALARGHVTFGSFNIPAKIGTGVIAAWAEILHRMPGSRLLLKSRGFGDTELQGRISAQFAASGIAGDRLDFLGPTDSAAHRAAMAQVDMALDPFPFTGSTTTLECLWMGLPLVTLRGETFCARHSACFLTVLGQTDLIAEDVPGYVDRIVRLASDPASLARLRAALRDRMAVSPLCDASRFARDFEALMLDCWTEPGK